MYNTNAPTHLSDASTDHAPVISGQLQQVLSVEENPSASSQTLHLRVIFRDQSPELTSRRGRRHPSFRAAAVGVDFMLFLLTSKTPKSERLRAGVLPPSLRRCVVMMTEKFEWRSSSPPTLQFELHDFNPGAREDESPAAGIKEIFPWMNIL